MYSSISPTVTDSMMESKINNEKKAEFGAETRQNGKYAKSLHI